MAAWSLMNEPSCWASLLTDDRPPPWQISRRSTEGTLTQGVIPGWHLFCYLFTVQRHKGFRRPLRCAEESASDRWMEFHTTKAGLKACQNGARRRAIPAGQQNQRGLTALIATRESQRTTDFLSVEVVKIRYDGLSVRRSRQDALRRTRSPSYGSVAVLNVREGDMTLRVVLGEDHIKD